MKVILEPKEDRWSVKDYNIIPISDVYDDHPLIVNEIETYKKAVNDNYLVKYNLKFDEVVATSPYNFTPASLLSSTQEEEPLAHLIGDGYIHSVREIEGDNYVPVDVAVVPSGVLRDSITEGNITVSDAFKILPLGVGKDGISGYPLISVYLSGEELKLVAEIDASISPILTFAKLYNTGMKYHYNPKRIMLNKVTDVKLWDGADHTEEIEDQQLYRVVTDLYTAQMLSVVNDQSFGLLSVVPKDSLGEPVTNYEDHIVYNNNHEELKVWVALTNYLGSFDKGENNIPTLDSKYEFQQGYKVIESSNGLQARFSNLNKFSITIILIVVILLFLIIMIIRTIYRKIRNRNNK